MSIYPQNPVIFEYWRGGTIESVHRGAFVVLREDQVVEARGAIQHRYFIRSAAKPLQTMALLANGVAEHFQLSDEELAIITASHGGEDLHMQTVSKLLAKADLTVAHLQCGTHEPFDKEISARLRVQKQRADALRHNCSGKHAGMLLFAKFLNAPLDNYFDPMHPVQQKIKTTLEQICACQEKDILMGMDGCSAPTFAIPLHKLALGFARIANPSLLPQELRAHASKLTNAIIKNPKYFGGTRQVDTQFIEATQGQIIAKRGAEGVYAAGVAGQNYGVAFKVDDGATRILGHLLTQLLERHGLLADSQRDGLREYFDLKQRNFAGRLVGELRVIFS